MFGNFCRGGKFMFWRKGFLRKLFQEKQDLLLPKKQENSANQSKHGADTKKEKIPQHYIK